jgi:transposase-like protein
MPRTKRSTTPATSRSPRRILTEDEKREVARLYSETTTPVPDIKRQFGIAESSLYRLIQQRGVAPRGRVPAATRSMSTVTRRRSVLNGKIAPARQPVGARSSKSGAKYRVSFAAVQTVTAKDIRDAIRQAEALGATTITAITRSE